MTPRPPALSRRTRWDPTGSELPALLEAARAGTAGLLDLTETNPTRADLAWDAAVLAEALAQGGEARRYDPDPRGDAGARGAIATYVRTRGAAASADHVVLTASTSEAYAFLLKLLCDPGDEILVPAPSYPLLEVLAQLESARLVRYPLRYDGTWYLDLRALAGAITSRTRAVVVISPSNPTGAVLTAPELAGLEALCADRRLALIGDEVFADTASAGAASVGAARDVLAFRLGGLSKTCGLPQLKVGWITVTGPGRDEALERLDMIADAFLSVSGPIQAAVPALLERRELFLVPLRARLEANRGALEAARAAGAAFTPLRSAGGWSATLQIGGTIDEEALCTRLLHDGVVVQPGYFYDFDRSGYLVVSLIPEPTVFREGLARVAAALAAP